MTSFLYHTIVTWLKIQRTEKLGALLCPEHHFPFTQSREGPYLQPYQRASRLVSRRGPPSGLPQLPHSPPLHGKSCSWDDTDGLPTATQGQGHQAPYHACLTWEFALPFSFPALTMSLPLPTTNLHLPTTSQMKTGKTLGPPHKPK